MASIIEILDKLSAGIKEIHDGRTIVTTAGTRERLIKEETPAKYVILTAETDNTGVMVIGDYTVVATQATRRGIPLNAGQSMGIPCKYLRDIWLDSTVSGDGVTYLYFR